MLNYGMQDIKYAKDEERRKNEKRNVRQRLQKY